MTTPPAHWARFLHLLWVVPVGLLVTYVGGVWMSLIWCGISGCSGGGFGRVSDPDLLKVLLGAAVVAIVWFGLLAAVGWHPRTRVRIITGVAAGLGITLVVMLWATAGFIR